MTQEAQRELSFAMYISIADLLSTECQQGQKSKDVLTAIVALGALVATLTSSRGVLEVLLPSDHGL